MRPGARSIVRTAFGLLMAAGGTLVAVTPAAAAAQPNAGLPHAVGGFVVTGTDLSGVTAVRVDNISAPSPTRSDAP